MDVMDNHPNKLNEAQRKYLLEIYSILDRIDRMYTGDLLEYDGPGEAKMVTSIASTQSKIEYVLKDGKYGPHQIRLLNNLRWLYYELKHMEKDPLALNFK